MTKAYQFKYEKTGLLSYKILIYFNDKIFGVVSCDILEEVSIINNYFFYLKKQKNIVVNAKTNEIICELEKYSDGSEHIEKNGRSIYLLRKGYTFNDNLVCNEIIERKGKSSLEAVEIHADTDIELILYSYLYFKITRN